MSASSSKPLVNQISQSRFNETVESALKDIKLTKDIDVNDIFSDQQHISSQINPDVFDPRDLYYHTIQEAQSSNVTVPSAFLDKLQDNEQRYMSLINAHPVNPDTGKVAYPDALFDDIHKMKVEFRSDLLTMMNKYPQAFLQVANARQHEHAAFSNDLTEQLTHQRDLMQRRHGKGHKNVKRLTSTLNLLKEDKITPQQVLATMHDPEQSLSRSRKKLKNIPKEQLELPNDITNLLQANLFDPAAEFPVGDPKEAAKMKEIRDRMLRDEEIIRKQSKQRATLLTRQDNLKKKKKAAEDAGRGTKGVTEDLERVDKRLRDLDDKLAAKKVSVKKAKKLVTGIAARMLPKTGSITMALPPVPKTEAQIPIGTLDVDEKELFGRQEGIATTHAPDFPKSELKATDHESTLISKLLPRKDLSGLNSTQKADIARRLAARLPVTDIAQALDAPDPKQVTDAFRMLGVDISDIDISSLEKFATSSRKVTEKYYKDQLRTLKLPEIDRNPRGKYSKPQDMNPHHHSYFIKQLHELSKPVSDSGFKQVFRDRTVYIPHTEEELKELELLDKQLYEVDPVSGRLKKVLNKDIILGKRYAVLNENVGGSFINSHAYRDWHENMLKYKNKHLHNHAEFVEHEVPKPPSPEMRKKHVLSPLYIGAGLGDMFEKALKDTKKFVNKAGNKTKKALVQAGAEMWNEGRKAVVREGKIFNKIGKSWDNYGADLKRAFRHPTVKNMVQAGIDPFKAVGKTASGVIDTATNTLDFIQNAPVFSEANIVAQMVPGIGNSLRLAEGTARELSALTHGDFKKAAKDGLSLGLTYGVGKLSKFNPRLAGQAQRFLAASDLGLTDEHDNLFLNMFGDVSDAFGGGFGGVLEEKEAAVNEDKGAAPNSNATEFDQPEEPMSLDRGQTTKLPGHESNLLYPVSYKKELVELEHLADVDERHRALNREAMHVFKREDDPGVHHGPETNDAVGYNLMTEDHPHYNVSYRKGGSLLSRPPNRLRMTPGMADKLIKNTAPVGHKMHMELKRNVPVNTGKRFGNNMYHPTFIRNTRNRSFVPSVNTHTAHSGGLSAMAQSGVLSRFGSGHIPAHSGGGLFNKLGNVAKTVGASVGSSLIDTGTQLAKDKVSETVKMAQDKAIKKSSDLLDTAQARVDSRVRGAGLFSDIGKGLKEAFTDAGKNLAESGKSAVKERVQRETDKLSNHILDKTGTLTSYNTAKGGGFFEDVSKTLKKVSKSAEAIAEGGPDEVEIPESKPLARTTRRTREEILARLPMTRERLEKVRSGANRNDMKMAARGGGFLGDVGKSVGRGALKLGLGIASGVASEARDVAVGVGKELVEDAREPAQILLRSGKMAAKELKDTVESGVDDISKKVANTAKDAIGTHQGGGFNHHPISGRNRHLTNKEQIVYLHSPAFPGMHKQPNRNPLSGGSLMAGREHLLNQSRTPMPHKNMRAQAASHALGVEVSNPHSSMPDVPVSGLDQDTPQMFEQVRHKGMPMSGVHATMGMRSGLTKRETRYLMRGEYNPSIAPRFATGRHNAPVVMGSHHGHSRF